MKIKNLSQKRGISLIVLVITIIVIIILAVAVILSIANNNPIENANKAKFQNDLKSMQEELELIKQKNYVESQGKDYKNKDGSDISIDGLSTANDNYKDKFTINYGTLKYLSSKLSDKEQEWAKEIGITAGGYVLKNGSDGVNISSDGKFTIDWFDSDTNSTTIPEGVSTDLLIPEGVTNIEGINGYMFCGSTLTSITLPSTLKSTGNATFSNCGLLTSVTMSEGIKEIEADSFFNCESLASITIPNSVTSIGASAFSGCTSLTSITIPSSVTSIGVEAFYDCISLKSIILEKDSPLIPANASDWGVDTTKCTVTKES